MLNETAMAALEQTGATEPEKRIRDRSATERAILKAAKNLLAEIQAQKLAFVTEVVRDWPQEEIDTFSVLFEKFIGGYEAIFLSRDKDTPG